MSCLRAAGLDIGSRSIELVAVEEGRIVHVAKTATTFDPLSRCRELLDGVRPDVLAATGYGRALFAEQSGLSHVRTLTEITAYALGVGRLFPQARSVLDIGGQDTKVICLAEAGQVERFEMNDRCAAGTGKFLEFMALALQMPVEDFGPFALGARRAARISSMCAVFAETEAVGLMSRGASAEEVALGLHQAIARRVAGQFRRMSPEGPVVFAGGVARNACMRGLFADMLGLPMVVPDDPDVVGALGAALFALAQAA